ncbi:MAG: phosphatase PAP2 family protein [Leadbetterella sp.]|nr:phosphatase PAP2 family protein [Leadbetterella sp.]
MYAPKIWEALLAGLLVSAVFSAVLKKLFAVPRPAAVLDHNTFIIMGKKLTGFNSLPSGHSITIFTVLTVLLFAFMPKKWEGKTLWVLFVVITGLILAFTRVGVGAHHPLDVISGSIIGYISGLSGIFISRKYKIGAWIGPKKYYPVFILLFLVCGGVLVTRIRNENLLVYYFSIISLAFSLYKIIQVYVQRR